MQAVLHQDIIALAKCLLPLPPSERCNFAKLQIQLADAADGYRKTSGAAHPIFGNGTLSSCCAKLPAAPERRLDDPDYAECMIFALEALIWFRSTPKKNGVS